MMPETKITFIEANTMRIKKLTKPIVKLVYPIIKLQNRYVRARFYMRKCGSSFRAAWRHAGLVL